MKPLDLTKQRFGKLVAQYPVKHKGRRAWFCECDCGKTTIVLTSNLTRGNSKACSICHKQNILKKHGRYKHPCYQHWRSMRQRCLTSTAADFHRYGGRGITICQRWDDIENFIIDMGKPPTIKHTLDRINPDGNYQPSNCRWATIKEQSRNKRTTLIVEGKVFCKWVEENGLKYVTALARLHKGWTLDQIKNTPDCRKRRHL